MTVSLLITDLNQPLSTKVACAIEKAIEMIEFSNRNYSIVHKLAVRSHGAKFALQCCRANSNESEFRSAILYEIGSSYEWLILYAMQQVPKIKCSILRTRMIKMRK